MVDTTQARSEERSEKRSRDDKAKPSKRAKFSKWLLAPAVVAGIAMACSSSTEDFVIPFPPDNQHETSDGGSGGTSDAGPDASLADSGPDMDSGPDSDTDADTDSGGPTDAGPDTDSGDMDSGPDLDADVDADTDSGGPTDAGPDTDSGDMDSGPDLDADVDADTDSGIETCDGIIYDEILIADDFERDIPVVVGGYHITFRSPTATGVRLDITCDGTGSDVAIDELFGIEEEGIIEVPSDGKRIRITPHSKNTWEANMTVIVEDIPGGVTDGGVSDAGPDSGADGGITDAGPDADMDSGVEVCVAATNESVSMATFDKNVLVALGGYNIEYFEQTPGGVVLNITCQGTGTDVVLGESIHTGPEYIIDIPSDAKIMRVTVHSRNTWDATMSVSIEDS